MSFTNCEVYRRFNFLNKLHHTLIQYVFSESIDILTKEKLSFDECFQMQHPIAIQFRKTFVVI